MPEYSIGAIDLGTGGPILHGTDEYNMSSGVEFLKRRHAGNQEPGYVAVNRLNYVYTFRSFEVLTVLQHLWPTPGIFGKLVDDAVNPVRVQWAEKDEVIRAALYPTDIIEKCIIVPTNILWEEEDWQVEVTIACMSTDGMTEPIDFQNIAPFALSDLDLYKGGEFRYDIGAGPVIIDCLQNIRVDLRTSINPRWHRGLPYAYRQELSVLDPMTQLVNLDAENRRDFASHSGFGMGGVTAENTQLYIRRNRDVVGESPLVYPDASSEHILLQGAQPVIHHSELTASGEDSANSTLTVEHRRTVAANSLTPTYTTPIPVIP